MRGHTFPPQHTHTHLLAIYIAYLEDCYGNRLPVVRGGGFPPQPHLGDERRARTRRKKEEKKKKKTTSSSSSSSSGGWGLPGSVSTDRNTKNSHTEDFFVWVLFFPSWSEEPGGSERTRPLDGAAVSAEEEKKTRRWSSGEMESQRWRSPPSPPLLRTTG